MIVIRTRHLLVDGANLLHAWPDLCALTRADRAAARALLVRRLAVLHDQADWRVTVVFDGRGPDLVVETIGGQPTFAAVTTPAALTADDVIEQLVGKAADPAGCTIATGDRAEAQTVTALGAQTLSPADLAAWIERVAARQDAHLDSLRRDNDHRWKHA
ncbi:MAG TPA: NYN domain-containing protein [Opitutaceae bacterium]